MITKKIILFAIVSMLVCGSSVSAAKRAPFPTSSTLQPIPVNVAPNVSGNVNSSGIPAPEIPLPEEGAQSETAPAAQEPIPSKSGSGVTVVGGVIIVALLAGILLRYKFKK